MTRMRRLAITLAFILAAVPASAEKVALEVARARADLDQRTAAPIVLVMLTDESSKKLAAFSEAHVGRRIRVTSGAKLLSSPVILEPILGPWLQVAGQFDMSEAQALAKELGDAGRIEVEPTPSQ